MTSFTVESLVELVARLLVEAGGVDE
jgi:hypothetical protein